MPLRLALTVAVGALLALAACSGGTKTVTRTETAPPAAEPPPPPPTDPAPAPAPAAVTLPAGAADAFPTGATNFTVKPDENDVDDHGNRFVDRFGYRFVCRGEEACVVTVTRAADGALSVAASGMVRKGEAPAVTKAVGIARFLAPASGSRQQFSLAAGETRSQNGVAMTCPAAAAAGCLVVIETRTAGDEAGTDATGTGGLVIASAYPPFYDGLAYYRTTPESSARDTDDPLDIWNDAGTHSVDFEREYQAGAANTYSHIRITDDYTETNTPSLSDEDTLPISIWGDATAIAQLVDVTPERVLESSTNVFAGFADGTSDENMAKTWGAAPVGVRLALTIEATHNPSLALLYDPNPLAWDVELPVAKAGGGADAAFAYGGADMRSAADRWSRGFERTTRLGADTDGDISDDGAVHVQAFLHYETDKTENPAADFGDVAVGAIAGTVLAVAAGGAVPDAVPATQTFAQGTTNGTFNGVPGVFTCANGGGCVVTTDDDGAQTLADGALAFAPTTGVQVIAVDSDWLAIGSWAVAMDYGNTVFGSFHQGGQPWATSIVPAVGEATFRGIARGRFAEYDDGARASGLFSGNATFTADFGNAGSEGGTIEGMLRDFSTTPYGGGTATDRADWEIDFAEVSLTATSHDGFGFTTSGKWGPEGDNTLMGASDAKFYGTEQPNVGPTAIAGSFIATSDSNDDYYDLTLFGAFGAFKQP